MYEMEIARLQGEGERLQKEKTVVQAQAAQSAAEVTRLKGRINDLQTQLQNIVAISIDFFHKWVLNGCINWTEKMLRTPMSMG